MAIPKIGSTSTNQNQTLQFSLDQNPKWVRSLEVDKLFGQHSFPDIRLFDYNREYPYLSFLYGENGVGKSTILQILFCLFNGSRGQGYKSYISKIPFKKFSVEFMDSQRVELHRLEDDLLGDIQVFLEGPRASGTFVFRVNDNKEVTTTLNPRSDSQISEMASLSIPIVYVNDRRTVRSTRAEWDLHNQAERHRASTMFTFDVPTYDNEANSSTQGLELLLESVQRAFANRAVDAAAIASIDMDNIYLSIAESIASPAQSPARRVGSRELLARIKNINSYLSEFGSSALVSAPNLDRISDLLRKQKAGPRDHLISVIEPYVAAVEKRIEASNSLAHRMHSFETNVNTFLHNKRLTVSINDKIRVMARGGEIEIKSLSSGERHLLHLFAVATLSHDNPLLILVDEPELSLNQIWQKKLVSSLLEVSARSTQYVMASHAFEIISKFKTSAVRLKYG